MIRKLALLLALMLSLSSCGIYSFSGTSIQPDVNTVTINLFEYKALKVNPTLSNDLTEGLKNRFRTMTRLGRWRWTEISRLPEKLQDTMYPPPP